MLFNSWQFLIFLPITFLFYFILPKKIRHIFLLVASYVFYMFWNWYLIFLIVSTTLVSFFAGLLIKKNEEKKKLKTFIMVSAVMICLAVLIFFKYFDFIASSVVGIVNAIGNLQYGYVALNLILPVGISFYTFQTLSYVIDVYRGKYEAEKNIFYYALYVSFFPQLVAGPIERADNLLPQFKQKEGIKVENLSIGLRYILKGYVEKVVIADIIGIFVNAIFNDINNANGLLIFVGAMLFAVQILGDFSGYSNIAIGVAKLFNIDLMKNFDSPYQATSIKDFWRRWHISLSKWFKDYLYIPLGGSRVSYFRWGINVLVVFIVSGLWHGAGFTFLIWGLLHGIYQIIGKSTQQLRDKAYEKMGFKEGVVKVIRIIITFLLISFAWIAFRANSLNDMLTGYKMLFTSWNFSPAYFEQLVNIFNRRLNVIIVILCIVLYLFLDKIIFKIKKKWISYPVYVLLIWLVIAAYLNLGYLGLSSSFVYFQF